MQIMILHPNDSFYINNKVRRSCTIERINDKRKISTENLFYEFPVLNSLPKEDDAEAYLIAMILCAMAEGRKLIVNGRVSHALLANLTEFRDAWCSWLPEVYYPVDFECNDISELNECYTDPNSAISAFSGGVDATFSLLRHSQKKAGYSTKNIHCCVTIHGFDIPLTDESTFNAVFTKNESFLEKLNIILYSLKTNYRQIVPDNKINWEHSFAAALVSCLQQFKCLCNHGIIGSSEPYNSLIFPWGSNPITDVFLSSPSLQIFHDGAAYSRTQKINELYKWGVCEELRVCWQGEIKSQNCGKCEKCLRTMLNFKANRLPIPKNFPESIDINFIKKLEFSNAAILSEWHQIVKVAKKNEIKSHWLKIIERKIIFKKFKTSIKNILKYLIFFCFR